MDLGLKKTNPLMTQGFCFVPSLAADNCGLSILVNHYAHTTNGKTINPLSMPNIPILVKSILVTLKVGQSDSLKNMKWDYPLPRLPWNLLGRLCNVMVDKQCLNELALFAGAGGGILGGHLLGWRTVCAVEWEAYPASVLCARQNDGLLPPFPIWDDVQTFDGKPWRGIVDVVSGGFPCTDISAAGKGAGIDGEASGMWREMARIIHEVRPRFVFVENSPMLTSRGLGRVLGDLASMGFDARWGVLGAADIGANHQRDRIWIVAKRMGNSDNNGQIASEIREIAEPRSNDNKAKQNETIQSQGSGEQHEALAYSRCELWDEGNSGHLDTQEEIGTSSPIFNQPSGQGQNVSNTDSTQLKRMCESERIQEEYTFAIDSRWWETEPDVGRMVNGVAAGSHRLKAIGNGQVPLCAATAWRILSEQK
jgi:DNA (cytosine-5)-methyltransferase 1